MVLIKNVCICSVLADSIGKCVCYCICVGGLSSCLLVIFWQHSDAPDMTKSNTQTIDYPYPTTNTPPLTTHHALVVSEALRCVCPFGDDRDAKENDWDDVSMSDKFSRKQLWNVAIVVLRRQKPSTNALDGLYLPCVDSMLEACWVEGCDESLSRHICAWWKITVN